MRSSALDEIHREPAERRLLVFRLHVGAGLAHGGDDLIERDFVAAVALEGERSGGDSLDGAESVALDTGDLHEAADRIAGHAEMMLHADFGGVFDLRIA